MRLFLSILITIMVVSFWKFSVSTVGLYSNMTHRTRKLQKYPHPDYEPRVSFEYQIFETPQSVVDIISEVIDSEKATPITEKSGVVDGNSTLYDIGRHPKLDQTIRDTLLPYAEEVAGRKLEASALYGVREYHKGAYLTMHFDSRETHIYSFTATHYKDADWPLRYMENDNEYIDIELESGQMMFYEGADYLHGRPSTFEGTSYMNWYVHFKPIELIENGNTTTSV